MNKQAVLLINTGTPDSPAVKDVWSYLTSFLNDARVISLPLIARSILVNAIIVPFRVRKSAGLYRKVWTDKGSPLRVNSEEFAGALQLELGDNYRVFTAMRYGNPSVKETLDMIRKEGTKSLLVVPMFPQYASSTTGSSLEIILRIISKWHIVPELKVIDHFHDKKGFIDAEIAAAEKYNPHSYDHLLFSFHGLPLSHIAEMHRQRGQQESCYHNDSTVGCRLCYAGACYETAELIAAGLKLDKDNYSVAFQSRFSRGWTSPFTDEEILRLRGKGVSRLLVMSPSFVSDCLETVVEVGLDYRAMFLEAGGEELKLVESLNSSPQWVSGFASIIRDSTL
jgi:protoporphyrin/coproporphyrin ferrochelatase